jgi:hypothetical protein
MSPRRRWSPARAPGIEWAELCLQPPPPARFPRPGVSGPALAAVTPVLVAIDADPLALQETLRALQTLDPSDFQAWLTAHS